MNRRHWLAAMASAVAALQGCASVGNSQQPVFVLVHGAWHGAKCWERVTPLLTQAGYAVHTPTLPGQGERAAEISTDITLDTHIASVCEYIESRNLRNVVLVGHSYGGVVITGVADRIAPRLKRLVFLDALIFDSGQSLASITGAATWEQRMKTVREQGRGVGLPPYPPAAFGVMKAEDAAWLAPQLTLQPVNTFAQPLVLRAPFGNGLPKVYIDCTQPAMAAVTQFKSKVRQSPGWTYETLVSGHDAMVIVPRELAAMLLKHV